LDVIAFIGLPWPRNSSGCAASSARDDREDGAEDGATAAGGRGGAANDGEDKNGGDALVIAIDAPPYARAAVKARRKPSTRPVPSRNNRRPGSGRITRRLQMILFFANH
jgi:hypothetical protein